ncbi:aspartoacylase [Ferrimonas pelagia]|uniref:Aspartoacylase n=1 Tax=Ferrimonas pelagia TaxID=1177826 RepID=A0ABP9ELA0_9GAMM
MEAVKVAIVGGTHGNEFSGIQLIKQWRQDPSLLAQLGIELDLVWSNPKAHNDNRRYLDVDLNRQFEPARLADPSLRDYEALLAKSLDQQLGPKGAAKTDLVIDLHNTTSHMGPTLILIDTGLWERQLAAFVKSRMPEAVILLEDTKTPQEWGYLCSLGKRGVMVEVGPQPQSVLRQEVLDQMALMTQLIVEFAALERAERLPDLPAETQAYRYVETRQLPLDSDGQPLAMIHPRLDGKDFEALSPGEPIFQFYNGEVGYFDSEVIMYPHFINEAAYYNSHNAFSLAERCVLTLEA